MKKTVITITLLLFSFLLTACDIEFVGLSQTYNIYFESNGGTAINRITVNSLFTESDLAYYETTKEGYTFGGWYIDEELTTPFTVSILRDDMILYAKWLEMYTITWKNDDGSIIATSKVTEGEMPIYEGDTPTKAYDGNYTYTFDQWSPSFSEVTSDQEYVATYTQTSVSTSFNNEDINDIFGFSISDLIPAIKTDNYEIVDDSNTTDYNVMVRIYDWSATDFTDFKNELSNRYVYNSVNDSWAVGSYWVNVYLSEAQTYFEISITNTKTIEINNWLEAETKIDDLLGYDINQYLDPLSDVAHLNVFEDSDYIYVTGITEIYNTSTAIDTYEQSLVNNSWTLSNDFSEQLNEDVYIIEVDTDYGVALFIDYSNIAVTIHFWVYEIIHPEEAVTLSPRTSITDWEVDEFGKSGLPSTGTYDVLVVPVEIKDHPFDYDYLSRLETVFNGAAEDTNWQSVSSFYKTSSYGQLDLSFVISDKYITDYDHNYYEDKADDGDQYAIKEAMNALDPTIDFSQYDYNNDGVIDSVIFIYSYAYDFEIMPWWAWVYNTEFGEASDLGQVDGKSLKYYMWASYDFLTVDVTYDENQDENAETYIHELGHLLGFPDLYPYDTYDFGPVGGWDMMDYNIGDHGPANKLLYGWLSPLVAVSGTYEITLDSYALDTDGMNSVILIPYNQSDLSDGNAFDEYLLIMFYTPKGLYEGHLNYPVSVDQAGVVVYHVDARVHSRPSFWGAYFTYNNEGDSNFFVEILEADLEEDFPSNEGHMSSSELLRTGSLNLATDYAWHQGGAIDVSITITSSININSTSVDLEVVVNNNKW